MSTNNTCANTGKKVLTFGEMMLRLAPPEHLRIEQATSFCANYGGAEANVAASLAIQGDNAAYVSVIPNNRIGDCALRSLEMWGVDTSRVIREGDRLGTYFFEVGASVRPNSVVYDRKYSAISLAPASIYNWNQILDGIDTFYFSGVTPAISDELTLACEQALLACKERGITVILDLNYRSKMWSEEKAQATMKRLLPYVDVVIANDEDAPSSLGISHGTGSLECGIDEKECYIEIARDICTTYGCKYVASVIRNIASVEKSDWMGMLYRAEDDSHVFSTIHLMHVLEGVAAGDAFGAGLIHAMMQDWDAQEMIDYAIAASVLKLTVRGDTNIATEAEIKALAHKSASGVRVAR